MVQRAVIWLSSEARTHVLRTQQRSERRLWGPPGYASGAHLAVSLLRLPWLAGVQAPGLRPAPPGQARAPPSPPQAARPGAAAANGSYAPNVMATLFAAHANAVGAAPQVPAVGGAAQGQLRAGEQRSCRVISCSPQRCP